MPLMYEQLKKDDEKEHDNDLDSESEHRAAAVEVLITDGGMTAEEAKYTVTLMLDVLLNTIKLGTLK